MQKSILPVLLVSIMLSGCGLKQAMDIGSARAVDELQEKHDDMLPIFQDLAANQEKLAMFLAEQHPDVKGYRRCAIDASRTAASAATLTKTKMSPYSSLGDLGGLLDALAGLLDPNVIIPMILAALGLGGAGTAMRYRGQLKKTQKLGDEVAGMDPESGKKVWQEKQG